MSSRSITLETPVFSRMRATCVRTVESATPWWRAIDIHEGDALDMDALAALLRAAIAYNQTHAVPKSRGSRA